MVKGTKMAFFGLKKDEEIKAVLAYLATFDPDGMHQNKATGFGRGIRDLRYRFGHDPGHAFGSDWY